MREIWVADSETEPFKHRRIPRPFIWGAYNGTEYHQFENTADFVAFIAARDCICYAHNGGKFDWLFLAPHFQAFDPIMVIGSRLAKFKIGEAEFRDSYNILPVPLREFAKDDFDYTLLEPDVRDLPQNRIKIEHYLRSDCVNLFNAIKQFIDTYGLSLTVAGAAMKQWRSIAGVKAPQGSRRIYNELAPFYYGGRVECFQKGIIKTPFKVVDINSAYPFAMTHLHPYGENYSVSDALPNSRAYIQRCFIELDCVARGSLPYRAADGSLSFPNDGIARTYHITGWEFLAAVDTRTIGEWEIIRVLRFPDSIEFGAYVDHFSKMKAEAVKGSADYVFAKLFLNALYGRFAMDPSSFESWQFVPSEFITAASELDQWQFAQEVYTNVVPIKRRESGGTREKKPVYVSDSLSLMCKPLEESEMRYYSVAVAASITGFVRAYLWRAICQSTGVLYCDTDSIACSDTGKLTLHPTNLGAWDLEAECDGGGIAGKKLYAFRKSASWLEFERQSRPNAKEYKTASKGVKLSPSEIMRVAKGETIVYLPEAPNFSIKQGIRIFGPGSESEKNLSKMFANRKVNLS